MVTLEDAKQAIADIKNTHPGWAVIAAFQILDEYVNGPHLPSIITRIRRLRHAIIITDSEQIKSSLRAELDAIRLALPPPDLESRESQTITGGDIGDLSALLNSK